MLQKDITPYELKIYLDSRGITVSRLAEITGMTASTLMSIFNRNHNWRGAERRFTPALVEQLNEALPKLAGRLIRAHVYFDFTQSVTKRGRCYDPSCTRRMKEEIAPLVDLTAICEKALGWSRSKKENVFVNRNSHSFGNITRDDVQRVNDYLDLLAEELSSFHIVMPQYSSAETRVRPLAAAEREAFLELFLRDSHECLEREVIPPEEFIERWETAAVIGRLDQADKDMVAEAIDLAKQLRQRQMVEEEMLLNS